MSRPMTANTTCRRRRAAPAPDRLECRGLLAVATLASSPPPAETVDLAVSLGDLSQMSKPATVTVAGALGPGPERAADVNWYRFTLDQPARVDLATDPSGLDHPLAAVLSLFAHDPGDPATSDGETLLGQQTAATLGKTTLTLDLAPGQYDVAVSGAGDTAFHPFLAGSGFPGGTGNYLLDVTLHPDPLPPGAGPSVLTSTPANDATVATSPTLIRVATTEALDPSTVVAGSTVTLLEKASGPADATPQPVPLAWVRVSPTAGALEVTPLAPLAPGSYELILSGNTGTNVDVIRDRSGLPLGADPAHPSGADQVVSFTVSPAASQPHDTASTAIELGTATGQELIQKSGFIGDLPSASPGNQVDLYHFQVTGPGRSVLVAEAFAGRIGSTLDAGLSLYRLDPSTGELVFVDGNNNSGDTARATNQTIPLFTDPILTDGLTAGDYYLAVSSGSNTPSPLEGQPGGPGTGIFDPNHAESGSVGFSTGAYQLNLEVTPAPQPPRVLATSPAPGAVLTAAPTSLTVQFSEPVNLEKLALEAFTQPDPATNATVVITASDGTRFFPWFASFDPKTNTASFLMLDRLTPGSYQLELAGASGLTDLAGNPLVGNSPGGSFVENFTISGANQGLVGSASAGYTLGETGPAGSSFAFGPLFPHELQAGMTIDRSMNNGSGTDSFRFESLQSQDVFIALKAQSSPSGSPLSLLDAQGNPALLSPTPDGQGMLAHLSPGWYTLSVSPSSGTLDYQVELRLVSQPSNPPPLLVGPSPAISVQFAPATPTAQVTLAAPTVAPGSVATAPATTNASTSDSSAQVATPALGPTVGPAPAGSLVIYTGHNETSSGEGVVSSGSVASLATAATSLSGPLGPAFASGGLLVLATGPVGGVGAVEVAANPAPTTQFAFAAPASLPGQRLLDPYIAIANVGTIAGPARGSTALPSRGDGGAPLAEAEVDAPPMDAVVPPRIDREALLAELAANLVEPTSLAAPPAASASTQPPASIQEEAAAALAPANVTLDKTPIEEAGLGWDVPDGWASWVAAFGVLAAAVLGRLRQSGTPATAARGQVPPRDVRVSWGGSPRPKLFMNRKANTASTYRIVERHGHVG